MSFAEEVETKLKSLRSPRPIRSGKLVRVVGLTLEAKGVVASLGAFCKVETNIPNFSIEAEVVGFQDSTTFLMPFSEPKGVGPGSRVWVCSNYAKVNLGKELLGRVIDGLGNPIDNKGPVGANDVLSFEGFPVNPMERGPIEAPLDTGIKAINSCLTVGRGQRMGLIAGSGVGKSVLMGMLTRNTEADVVVIGLIGERGREVQEFINETLGKEGLAKSVVVAAPANVSPVVRIKATQLAHLVAEYFRNQGKHVMLLLDSLTRVAHAQREIGLAIGEPPTAKGYPPSVFALLPQLIERAGVGKSGHGSITAFYTVLAENDDGTDPVVDIARASLDGQVMLSRSLADIAHYPAIDLSGSVSRVMPAIVSASNHEMANKFRRLWTLYQQNQDLIKVGAYETGTNAELDEAILKRESMESFLRQAGDESKVLRQCQLEMNSIVGSS